MKNLHTQELALVWIENPVLSCFWPKESYPLRGSSPVISCHPVPILTLTCVRFWSWTEGDCITAGQCRHPRHFTTLWVFSPLHYFYFHNIHEESREYLSHISHITKYDEWPRCLSLHNNYQPFKPYSTLTFYLVAHYTILFRKIPLHDL